MPAWKGETNTPLDTWGILADWPASCVYLSRKERELESNGRNGRGGRKSQNNCHWAGQQRHIELIWDEGQPFHSDMKQKFKSKRHGKIGEWNLRILCTYEEEQLCKFHCWAQWVEKSKTFSCLNPMNLKTIWWTRCKIFSFLSWMQVKENFSMDQHRPTEGL